MRVQRIGRGKSTILHIEARGCLINVREHLHNSEGEEVTSVEVIPDNYSEDRWTLDGSQTTRVIRKAGKV